MIIQSVPEVVICSLEKGDLVYYASFIATSEDRPHLLQLTQVQKVNDTTVFLDNGKKFSIGDERETCRGESGCLYEYSPSSEAMVKESQAKLSVLNAVEAIDFSALPLSKLSAILDVAAGLYDNVQCVDFDTLSPQQLAMIHDVARGAFTQVTNFAPCGGGCGELGTPMTQPTLGSNDECYETMESDGQSVQVSGLAFDVDNARKNGWGMGTPNPLDKVPTRYTSRQINDESTNTPVVFADTTFELSDGEDVDDEDCDDDTEAVE